MSDLGVGKHHGQNKHVNHPQHHGAHHQSEQNHTQHESCKHETRQQSPGGHDSALFDEAYSPQSLLEHRPCRRPSTDQWSAPLMVTINAENAYFGARALDSFTPPRMQFAPYEYNRPYRQYQDRPEFITINARNAIFQPGAFGYDRQYGCQRQNGPHVSFATPYGDQQQTYAEQPPNRYGLGTEVYPPSLPSWQYYPQRRFEPPPWCATPPMVPDYQYSAPPSWSMPPPYSQPLPHWHDQPWSASRQRQHSHGWINFRTGDFNISLGL